MSELRESLEAAIGNAADKLAEADTVQEAQAWQSVISNLNGIMSSVAPLEVSTQGPEPTEAHVAPPVDPVPTVETTDENNQVEKSNDS